MKKELVGYYWDGKNSWELYLDNSGRSYMKKVK